jgi:cyclase
VIGLLGVKAEEVADGVLAFVQPVGRAGTSNAAAIIDSGTATVVDTLLCPALAVGIREELQARSVCPETVVNTHPHIDHTGGNASFSDCELLADPATVRMVSQLARDASFLPGLFPEFAEELRAIRILPPSPLDVRTLGRAARATVLSCGPAHTPGDIAVWMPGERVLISGDLCFNGVTPLALGGHAHVSRWVQAVDELIALEPQVVVPGHGPVGSVETLRLVRDYLESLLAAARLVVQSGADLPAAIAALDVGPVSEWAHSRRTEANLLVAISEVRGVGGSVVGPPRAASARTGGSQ